MKILYAASLGAGSSAAYRMRALHRLGHELVVVNLNDYNAANPVLRRVEFRLVVGPQVDRLNVDLLRLAQVEKPDVFWADKVLKLKPATLTAMRGMGIFSVSYMIDNAFGPRRDPGWRLYLKCLRFFDLHVTQRDVSVRDYLQRGARAVIKIQTAFEPSMQYPPPVGWSDQDRDREVSFVGSPYDNRAEMLAQLSSAGLPVTVSGAERAWTRALPSDVKARMYTGEGLYDDLYREAIWKSKINISFLTRANLDEYTHKSFEIAGCEGFLLAERCAGHSAKFVEDEEAVFFSDVAELKAKIVQYLPDETRRARIAAAGRLRAVRDGYDNDTQLKLVLERVARMRQE